MALHSRRKEVQVGEYQLGPAIRHVAKKGYRGQFPDTPSPDANSSAEARHGSPDLGAGSLVLKFGHDV